MKNILVAIGASERAVNTLQYAIDFAEKFDAKLFVASVYDSTRISGSLKNVDAVLEKDAANEVNTLVTKVNRKNVDIVIVSAKGRLADSIESISKELAIDLLVISAKPVSTDETLFLGKASGSLVKDTSIPVLIVPTQYRYKDISRVLVTVKSGRVKSNNTLYALNKIKEKYNAVLNLIQVITPKLSNEEKEVNAELKELATKVTTTENATVFQGVLEHLHSTEPDMLCVMRRKRGFFSRLWQDDAVKKADFESRLPLLVLKGDK